MGKRVHFMSSRSSSRSSSFTFQSSKFDSSSISNRPAQVVWKDDWNRTGRQNDKSARGHETGQGHKSKFYIPHLTLS